MSGFNFSDAARRAIEDAATLAAQRAQDATDADKAESLRMERARHGIEQFVLPLAEQAKLAFEAEGVGVRFNQSEGHGGFRHQDLVLLARLNFECFDPIDPNGDKLHAMSKAKARFEHDGSKLRAFREWQDSDHGQPLDTADAIGRELTAVLRHFLSERDQARA